MKIYILLTLFLISCQTSPEFEQYYPGLLQNSHFNFNYGTENNRENYNIIINDNLYHYNPIYPYQPLLLPKGNYISKNEFNIYFKKTSILNALSNANPKEFYTFEYSFENFRDRNLLLNVLSISSLLLIPNSSDLKYSLKTKFSIDGNLKKEYSITKTVNSLTSVILFPYLLLSEPYKFKENYIFYLLIKETNIKIVQDFFNKSTAYNSM